MHLRSALFMLCILPVLGQAAEPARSDLPPLSFSEPKEEDAMQIQTKSKNKQEVQNEFGEPTSVKALDAARAPCVERWYYKGKADIGLGPMTVILFIDFDAHNKVCEKK